MRFLKIFTILVSSILAVGIAKADQTKAVSLDEIKGVLNYQKTGTNVIVLDSKVTTQISHNQPGQAVTIVKPNMPFYLWLNLFIPEMIASNTLYISLYSGEVPLQTYSYELGVKKGTAIQQYPFWKELKVSTPGRYNLRVFYNNIEISKSSFVVANSMKDLLSTTQTVNEIPPYRFSAVMLNDQNTTRLSAKMGEPINIKFKVQAPRGTTCPGCIAFFMWGYYDENGETGGLSCALNTFCQIPTGSNAGGYSEFMGMKADCDVPFTPTKPGTYYFTAQRLWEYNCKPINFDPLQNNAWAIIDVK